MNLTWHVLTCPQSNYFSTARWFDDVIHPYIFWVHATAWIDCSAQIFGLKVSAHSALSFQNHALNRPTTYRVGSTVTASFYLEFATRNRVPWGVMMLVDHLLPLQKFPLNNLVHLFVRISCFSPAFKKITFPVSACCSASRSSCHWPAIGHSGEHVLCL